MITAKSRLSPTIVENEVRTTAMSTSSMMEIRRLHWTSTVIGSNSTARIMPSAPPIPSTSMTSPGEVEKQVAVRIDAHGTSGSRNHRALALFDHRGTIERRTLAQLVSVEYGRVDKRARLSEIDRAHRLARTIRTTGRCRRRQRRHLRRRAAYGCATRDQLDRKVAVGVPVLLLVAIVE